MAGTERTSAATLEMVGDPDQRLETLAAELEATGEFRVLRKLRPRPTVDAPAGATLRTGLFLDVETTGLDPRRDEIIELAMTPFRYGLDGRIYALGESFCALRQPSTPIPDEITEITGITNEMVAGKAIDLADVARFAAPAAIVVAHNAAFDRKFLERFCDVFTTKPWACSMTQVDWAAEGHEGLKLAYLAASAGFFYDKHRAQHDCAAAIELLARPLPKSGGLALAQLLERARRASWRIWAEHAPFDMKDLLKARGYRWNPDGSAAPKAWYADVDEAAVEAEIAFLSAEVYGREVRPLTRRIDAYDRFSERCD